MKSIDIVDFELSVKTLINDYDLPTELKRRVVKDIYTELTMLAQREVMQQSQERDEEKKKHITIYHEDNKPGVTKEETDTEESFF